MTCCTLTVIIVGDHKAIIIVRQQRLLRWLCGYEEVGVGQSPSPATPSSAPALPISSFLSSGLSSGLSGLSSGVSSGSSAFSTGRSGQNLLLLGGGLGCFWRRIYSTEGRWALSDQAGRALRQDRQCPGQGKPTHSPHSPLSLSGHCSPAWASQSPPPVL